MLNKFFKSLLFLIPLLLFFSHLVFAEISVVTYPSVDNSFTVISGPDSINLCQCGTFTENLVVRNDGSFTSRYLLSSSRPDLVTFSEPAFELLPGQSKNLFVYYRAPCKGLVDDSIELSVVDVFGNQAVIEKSFESAVCQDLVASLIAPNRSINPCEQVSYSVVVENPGIVPETYEVFFGGDDYSSYFYPSSQLLIVPPGSSGVVSSNLSLDCSISGNLSIPFRVVAKRSLLEADLVDDLQVLNNYDFSLSSSDASVCKNSEGSFFVNVTNLAPLSNDYFLSFNGPSFLSLDANTSFSLGPGESLLLPVTINPWNITGSYDFIVRVESRYGSLVRELKSSVLVDQCYDLNLSLSTDGLWGCSDKKEVEVFVTNTGSKDEVVSLSSDGPYGYLSSDELSLAPNESDSVKLIFDIPRSENVRSDFFVYGSAGDVTKEDSLFLDLVDEQSCYQPLLKYSVVAVSQNDSFFNLTIINSGREDASYKLGFSGSDVFSLVDDDLFVKAGESSQVSFRVVGNLSQPWYGGSLFLESGDASYKLDFSVRVKELTGFQAAWSWIVDNSCKLVSVFLLVVALLLLVFVFVKRRFRRFSFKFFFGLIVLWLLIVLLSLSFYGLPSFSSPAADPLSLVVHQNDNLVVNLSSYFSDPDNDALSFEVVDLDHAYAEVSGSELLLIPDKDFVGVDSFRIIADDGRGGSTLSPLISLNVVEAPSLSSYYADYCVYLNLLLLLVVFLLLFTAYCMLPSRRRVSSSSKRSSRSKASFKKKRSRRK